MSSIPQKLSAVAAGVRDYSAHLTETTAGINSAETGRIAKTPELLQKYAAEVGKVISEFDTPQAQTGDQAIHPPADGAALSNHVLDHAIKIYTMFLEIDMVLAEVQDYHSNSEYVRAAVHRSQNPGELLLARDVLENAIVAYSAERRQFDAVQMPQIADNVITTTPADDIIDYITSIEPNKFAILLMTKMMPTAGRRKRDLIALVERQKGEVLGSTLRPPAPVRWGLVPATRSFPAPVIIGIMDGKIPSEGPARSRSGPATGPKSQQDSRGNVDASHAPVAGGWRDFSPDTCAMIVRVGTPMEFSLDSICSEDYIESRGLKIPLGHGVNKKVLEKYDTATLLTKKSGTHATPFRCRGAEGWVLETLTDGTSFRILSADGTVRKTAKTEAPGLFEQYGEKIPSRSAEYHRMQSPTIIAKCVNTRRDDIMQLFEEFDSHRPASGTIMQKIVEGYMRGVSDAIDSAGLPHTPEEAKSLFLNHSLATRVISDILVHSNGTKSTFSAEYLFTYIAHFDTVDTSFIREMDNNWQKSAIDDRVFKEFAGPQLRDALMTAYNRVVVGAVEVLDQAGSWSGYDWSQKTFFIDRR